MVKRKKTPTSKLKIENNDYIGNKIGRIKSQIAKEAHIKCADIYLSKSYQRHISNGHKQQIERLGMTVLEYIQYIVRKYNQIRDAGSEALMLVVYTKGLNHGAVIELSYVVGRGIYILKTAHPVRTKDLEKKASLWNKKTES